MSGERDANDATDPRQQAIEAMVEWCHDGDRPLWLIQGPAGAGKTRLANEVAYRLTAQRWPCGWARPGLAAYAVTAAARNGRRALLLVDDAETRADLFELLRTVANGGMPLSVRVIVVARDFGDWWESMLSRLSPPEQEALASGRTIMGGGGITLPTAQAVALRSLELGDGPKGQTVARLATADPFSGAVLLRLAALVVALSTRVGQLGPAEVRSALRDLFEEEEGYWRRAAGEVIAPGQPTPALRSALAASAVVGTDGLSDAATVLRRVPALAVGAADRLARLAVWWHGLYGRVGDAGAPTPRLPVWLAERLPDGTDSTGISWTVAALDAERRATSTLANLTLAAHRDVWPLMQGNRTAGESSRAAAEDAAAAHASLRRAVDAAAPVDEALAWLTQELELSREDLEALGEAISYPTRSLSRTALVLARRLLDGADSDEDRAELLLSLGARCSELGRWAEARRHTELAVQVLRELAGYDRERYLPDLAAAVSNLATCLAQLGERDQALTASYEAVAMHRELLETDRDGILPALARALTNLSACLSRSGRRPAALGAAGQAVAIYRELVELNPNAYRGELAAADHNWRVCRQAVDKPIATRPATGSASITMPVARRADSDLAARAGTVFAGEGGKVIAESDLGDRAGTVFAGEGGKVIAESAAPASAQLGSD
jgi:tetratricopeptide (TPR) repeat protein